MVPTCGCSFIILRNPDGFEIEWCPLHSAAEATAAQRDQLLEAAKEALGGLQTGWIENESHRSQMRRRKLEASLQAAIAKAEQL